MTAKRGGAGLAAASGGGSGGRWETRDSTAPLITQTSR